VKKFFIVFIIIWSLLPVNKTLAQSSNAGFVPGNIWYSIDPFEEGDKVKIYTVLFNPDPREFSGTVIFFDKATFLGKKDFAIAGRGVKDISIDWVATLGDHTIFAKIENAKFLISPNKYENVYLSGNQTEESKRTVNKKISTKTNTDSVITIPSISKVISDGTPDIISKPIIATTDSIENLRENIGLSSKQNIEKTKQEIHPVPDKSGKKITEPSNLVKPFKYIKLFSLYLISFIFNNKIIFYGIFVLIVFLFLRFLWRKIF
jgi:hypothetical protein